MGYIKIWVHLVWTTKNREPVLSTDSRKQIFSHIHCLVSLGSGQNIDKIVQLLKGESSCWINKGNLLHKRFVWQSEYFAVSVSESSLNRVRDYIVNQEEHHRRKSFQEEYDEFMTRYKFDKFVSG
jgi:putative transposase